MHGSPITIYIQITKNLKDKDSLLQAAMDKAGMPPGERDPFSPGGIPFPLGDKSRLQMLEIQVTDLCVFTQALDEAFDRVACTFEDVLP